MPVALVAGATGAVAMRLVERLLGEGWTVVGVCRRVPDAPPPDGLAYVAADLLDAEQGVRALRSCPLASRVTHVVYSARAPHGESGTESVPDNVAMLATTLDGVLPVARGLAHVHLVEGGKWYGMHLGPYPTPAREDDPRPATANFYHAQEDLLRERRRGMAWTWSASRPNILCDFAPGRARNLTSVLGAWAAVLRELGEPLHFPGTAARWHALMEATDATLLARAIRFIVTDERAANAAFNVTNGDAFRWERFWPRLAAHFGMPVGDVRPVSLASFMQDKDPVWQRVVQRFGLLPSRLGDVAAWPFGDFVFRLDHDILSSMTALRRAGFGDVVDTEAMLLRQLGQYRGARILP
jgi:nucleoside-diphosphate-sugar epimerase